MANHQGGCMRMRRVAWLGMAAFLALPGATAGDAAGRPGARDLWAPYVRTPGGEASVVIENTSATAALIEIRAHDRDGVPVERQGMDLVLRRAVPPRESLSVDLGPALPSGFEGSLRVRGSEPVRGRLIWRDGSYPLVSDAVARTELAARSIDDDETLMLAVTAIGAGETRVAVSVRRTGEARPVVELRLPGHGSQLIVLPRVATGFDSVVVDASSDVAAVLLAGDSANPDAPWHPVIEP